MSYLSNGRLLSLGLGSWFNIHQLDQPDFISSVAGFYWKSGGQQIHAIANEIFEQAAPSIFKTESSEKQVSAINWGRRD